MKVCYFGTYEKDYHRNKIFIDGLKQNNIEINECHEPLWEKIKHKNLINLFFLIPRMIIAYKKLSWKALGLKRDFRYVMVGYPPFIDILIAKIIFKKKIVYNPLISLYDTLVEDRKYFGGIFGELIKFIDYLSYKSTDIVFVDTKAHANYLIKEYPVLRKKLKIVPVGIDPYVFYPKKAKKNKNNKKNKFSVFFVGKFIPLHGIEKIIIAAKILEKENVEFILVGSGQLDKKANRLIEENNVKNIKRILWIPENKLVDEIAKAEACLGIFGDSKKAKIVVPTKVYYYIACGKATITMDSPASQEIFKNRKNAILCKNTPEEIAKSILLLKKDKKLRNNVAKEGYKLFLKSFTTKKIGEKIKKEL